MRFFIIPHFNVKAFRVDCLWPTCTWAHSITSLFEPHNIILLYEPQKVKGFLKKIAERKKSGKE